MKYKPLTLDRVMPFGKHKGKLILEIAINNPEYLLTLDEKNENVSFERADLNYIKAQASIRWNNYVNKSTARVMNNDGWKVLE